MTTSFSVTRDQVIIEALGICGVYDVTNGPGTADFASAAFTLNCMIKQWMIEGLPMWKIQVINLPLVVGTTTYQIGPYATGVGALVTPKVDRITYASRRNSNVTPPYDTPIDIISIQEYQQYGAKFAQGIPNAINYVPLADDSSGLNNSYLNTYPTISLANYSLQLVCQINLNDVNLGTDPVDFPQECYLGLCWCLADLLSMKYASSMDRVQWIHKIAYGSDDRSGMYGKLVDWSQENSDYVRFMYDNRGGMR